MVEFELAMAKTEYDKAIKSLVDLSKISAGYQARAEKAEAALARVRALIASWQGGTGHADNNRFVSIADLRAALKEPTP